MSLSAVMTTAAQGMDAQASRLSAAADNIANADTPGYRREVSYLTTLNPGSSQSVKATVRAEADASGGIDPTSEMVDLIESASSFALNADVFETGADLWQLLSTIKRD